MSTRPKAGTVAGDDDAEWALVGRLYDTPEEQWGVEHWRALAVFLGGAYQDVASAYQDAASRLDKATTAHLETLDLLNDVLANNKNVSAHSKLLQSIEELMRAGRLKIVEQVPPKKRGRKKKAVLRALRTLGDVKRKTRGRPGRFGLSDRDAAARIFATMEERHVSQMAAAKIVVEDLLRQAGELPMAGFRRANAIDAEAEKLNRRATRWQAKFRENKS